MKSTARAVGIIHKIDARPQTIELFIMSGLLKRKDIVEIQTLFSRQRTEPFKNIWVLFRELGGP